MRSFRFIFLVLCIIATPLTSSVAALIVGIAKDTKAVSAVGTEQLFEISLDELTASTLTESRMLEIGLDISAFNSPLLDYELAYILTVLSASAADVSEWQSDLGSKGSQEAAQWKLNRFSDGTDNTTALTFAMIDTAVGGGYSSSAMITARGEDLSTIQSFWSGASIDTNSPSSIKTFLATNLTLSSNSFASANEGDAYLLNADNANFTIANFSACYSATDSITGGANTCSITNAQWSSVNLLQTAVTDNSSTNITKANLDTAFGIDNSSYGVDLTVASNLEYAQDCIRGVSSNSWSNIKSCVTSTTAKVAAKWKVYQISLGTNTTDHPSSDFTVALYDRAVSDNGSGFLQDILDARPSLTLTTLRNDLSTYFTANSITDQSSDTNFKQFPVNKAGFKDNMTSYNSWVANSGFSVSSVDNSSEDIVRVWEACRRSRDTTSGGSTICSPSYATWAARAADRASNNIIQVRSNDFSGPRIYYETLMGITFNVKTIATPTVTQFRWNDHTDGTLRQYAIGWTSASGHYSFFNQGGMTIAMSPPAGGQLTKQ